MGIAQTGGRMDAQHVSSGNPATENVAVDLYPGTLGLKMRKDGKEWRRIRMDSAVDVAVTAGALLYWKDRTKFLVSTDVSVCGRGNPAGVAGTALTLNYYGYVQRQGPITSLNLQASTTAAPSTAGLIVIPSATDGVCDVVAAGTAAIYPKVGITSGAETTDACAAILDVDDGFPE